MVSFRCHRPSAYSNDQLLHNNSDERQTYIIPVQAYILSALLRCLLVSILIVLSIRIKYNVNEWNYKLNPTRLSYQYCWILIWAFSQLVFIAMREFKVHQNEHWTMCECLKKKCFRFSTVRVGYALAYGIKM